MNSLPLSWSIVSDLELNSKVIKKWDFEWLAINNLSSSYSFNISDYQNSSKKNIIIRGCNKSHKSELENIGFSSLLVGYEAILDLNNNPFTKKSLRELVSRGKRYGKLINIPFSYENKVKLDNFQKVTSHGNEPQLKNLFQMSFEKDHFLYVYIDRNANWLGAILISQNSDSKLHTELLLRKNDSPIGIMESLLEYVFHEAKKMSFKELSLGEVPFTSEVFVNGNLKSKILQRVGNLVSFSYNYKGLYNFKNKFDPKWNKIFICSSEKVGFKHLFFLLIYSNFHKLIAHHLIYSIKKNFYSFFYQKGKNLAKSA